MSFSLKIRVREYVESALKGVGLECLGVVSLSKEEPDFSYFEKWLASGHHGTMGFLENHKDCRKNPTLLHPKACSAVIIGYPYYQGDKWPGSFEAPRIAQYACLADYHKVMKKKCAPLGRYLESQFGVSSRLVVDSAPLLERALASRVARGFIGKNTCFIHPEKGSFYLLGELLVDLALDADSQALVDQKTRGPNGGCGTCRRCQVFCPTGALSKDYSIDASKCLAYYSIEHRGLVPLEYWPHFGKYLFGCDICQLVCPYNRKIAAISKETIRLHEAPPLEDIALMSQSYYESTFGGTPLTRAKKTGLRRNALISMVVTSNPKLPQVLCDLTKEGEPLLMGTVAQIPDYQRSFSNRCQKA